MMTNCKIVRYARAAIGTRTAGATGDAIAARGFIDRFVIRLLRFCSVLLLAICLCFAPNIAFADYINTSVNTTASVQTTGSMRIVEQRSMSFDEDYSAISLKFTGLPSDVELEVMSVRLIHMGDSGVEGEWQTLPEDSFQSAWREAFGDKSALTTEQLDLEMSKALQESTNSLTLQNNSWSLDERNSLLYVFYPFTGRMLVEVDVAISNAVFVYDDVAELYWDYISANNSAETENVEVSIQLPVPEAVEVKPGENVLAWGHGPEGVVDVSTDGTITYTVSDVFKGQYAQAHILFPESWLTNLPREMEVAYSGTHRDAAIASEETWADTWSNSQINKLTVDIAVLVFCFLMVVAAMVLYFVFGREKLLGKDSKDGKDTPADQCSVQSNLQTAELLNYDPAVIGRLMRWNHRSINDFVATLMNLAIKNVIQVDRVEDEGSQLGSYYGDFVIRTKPDGKSGLSSDLDRETMRVLFGIFADGYQKISINEIFRFAKTKPKAFADAIDGWQNALTDEVRNLGLFDERSKKIRMGMIVACIAMFALALILGLSSHVFLALAMLVSAGCVAVLGNYTIRRNELGIHLSDQMQSYIQALSACENVCENTCETIDGVEVEPYVSYLFACNKDKDIYPKIANATDDEQLWLSPVKGRGGKSLDCNARRIAYAFEKAIEEARG